MKKVWFALLLCALAHIVQAEDLASQVRLTPRFGNELPRATPWRDEYGKAITFGEITQGRPTLLVLAYYHCPMLCPRVLQSLAMTLRGSGIGTGDDLRIVVASIDPRDTPTFAIASRQEFLDRAQLPEKSVRFLTGPAESSKQLADAVGFHYAYDAEHDEYAHPAEFVLTNSEGRVARYLPAFTTTTRDLRLAIADLSTGTINNLWDHALLLCYSYDPVVGRYTVAITKLVRGAGILMVLLMVAAFWYLRRRAP